MEYWDKDITNTELLNHFRNILKTESEQIRKDIKAEIALENTKTLKKIEDCFNRLDQLENKFNNLNKKLIYLDRRLRKNNIIIVGLNIPENSDLIDFVLNKIKDLIDIDLSAAEINNIELIKIGKHQKAIKLEFISYLKKKLILRNCNKLKGKNIYINDDLGYEDRQDRKVLTKHLKTARSKGYFAKIQGRTLIVNDDIYNIDQLTQMDISGKSPKPDVHSSHSHTFQQSNSAPQTPTHHITYFEDSLNVFRLETPKRNLQNTKVTEKTVQTIEHQEGQIKSPKAQNRILTSSESLRISDNKPEKEYRNEKDLEVESTEENKSLTKERTEENKKLEDKHKQKKLEDKKKQDRSRNNSSSSTSRIVTRNQNK